MLLAGIKKTGGLRGAGLSGRVASCCASLSPLSLACLQSGPRHQWRPSPPGHQIDPLTAAVGRTSGRRAPLMFRRLGRPHHTPPLRPGHRHRNVTNRRNSTAGMIVFTASYQKEVNKTQRPLQVRRRNCRIKVFIFYISGSLT